MPIWLLGGFAARAAKGRAQVCQNHGRAEQRAFAFADAIAEPGTDAIAHAVAHSEPNALAVTGADSSAVAIANGPAEPGAHTRPDCAAHTEPDSRPNNAAHHCTISAPDAVTDAAPVR